MTTVLQSWQQISWGRGRLDLTGLLFEHYWRKSIEPADISEAVLEAWVGADSPQAQVHISEWFYLLAQVGFRVDGVPAERPPEPLILFRGSTSQLRRRASWTSLLEQAKTFASKTARRTGLPTAVYRGRFQPEKLMAELTHQRGSKEDGELEFIVDTRGARVTEVLGLAYLPGGQLRPEASAGAWIDPVLSAS